MDTRRAFVTGFLVAAASCALAKPRSFAQNPDPIVPQDRRDAPDSPHEAPINPAATKKILEDNEKDIKKKIERLYQLATELKAEVDKTDSSKVLSLALVKKAEEIEKLAHDIKNRSRG